MRRSCSPKAVLRIVAALLVSVMLALAGSVALRASAAPTPGYELSQTYPGDDLHIPILMYRYRHTELPDMSNAPPGTPKVGYAANVAAYNFRYNGVEMVAVAQSINRFPNQPKTALIDFYRKNPETGEWELVDLDGKPLTDNGVPRKWNEFSRPSVTWDLSQETDPEIVDELKSGIHSERVISLYLKHKLNGANKSTTKGLSERIPCVSPRNQCRIHLAEGDWFPNLVDMRYIVDLPNTVQGVLATATPAPTASSKAKGKGSKAGVKYHTAPEHLADIEDSWEADGMPTNHDDVVYGLGYREFDTPDSEPATGPAASALAPGSNPGGIDFSTLQLRYLSEAPGGRLQYAFAASGASPSVHNVGKGRIAAVQASDAFFIWLSMPRSSFWVNLNPNEPDRIVDATLGTTDVGRILLQADFAMKKLVGKLIYPKSPLGKRYWATSHPGSCLDTRQWIVPAPATVYEHGGGVSIIKAPLTVKMESQYLKGQSKADTCIHPDAKMEKAFRTLVLPKVIQAVNHAPQFAELRRVYLSRVAAEWYRTKHGRDGALRSLIDSGNVSDWRAMKAWSPRTVFNQYVHSFKHKEFNVTERTRKGNKVNIKTYTYGGVDFSKVLLHEASTSAVHHDDPGLSGTVQKSFGQVTKDRQGTVWLGAVSRPHMPKAVGPTPTGQPVFPAGDLVAVPGLRIPGRRVRRRPDPGHHAGPRPPSGAAGHGDGGAARRQPRHRSGQSGARCGPGCPRGCADSGTRNPALDHSVDPDDPTDAGRRSPESLDSHHGTLPSGFSSGQAETKTQAKTQAQAPAPALDEAPPRAPAVQFDVRPDLAQARPGRPSAARPADLLLRHPPGLHLRGGPVPVRGVLRSRLHQEGPVRGDRSGNLRLHAQAGQNRCQHGVRFEEGLRPDVSGRSLHPGFRQRQRQGQVPVLDGEGVRRQGKSPPRPRHRRLRSGEQEGRRRKDPQDHRRHLRRHSLIMPGRRIRVESGGLKLEYTGSAQG